MNPVGAEGNMFANLFDKVPARRAGKLEDIAGTVLYLCSQAGVSVCICYLICGCPDHFAEGVRGRTLSVRGRWQSIGGERTVMRKLLAEEGSIIIAEFLNEDSWKKAWNVLGTMSELLRGIFDYKQSPAPDLFIS